MEQLALYFSSPISALVFSFVGTTAALIGTSFLSKYVESRAVHVAGGVNLQEQLSRAFSDQAAKSAAARLDVSKAEYAMRLLGLMSEIESMLLNWKLTAFFQADELEAGQTVEDLGIRDLKQASKLTLVLLKTANESSVLLSDDIAKSIVQWVGAIHSLLFDYMAVYAASKELHVDKPPMHVERIKTISELAASEIYPKADEIGKLKREIKAALIRAGRITYP